MTETNEIEVSGMGDLRDRVGNLEKGLAVNTAATQRIEASALRNEADTVEMLDMFRSAKGGFRVLGLLGNVLKWAAAVGASLAGLYLALKGK